MPPLPDIQSLWDYGDPEQTERRLRDALAVAEGAGDRGYYAELVTQIARTYSLRDRFDDAHRTLDEAQAILAPDTPRARVRCLLERGRTHNSAGEPDRARPHFQQAWELAGAEGLEGLAVDAAHMLAIVASPGDAMAWNRCALELAERSADPDARRWRGSLHNNIGWTHHGQGRYDDALTSFEKALECRQEQGRPQDVRIARWCIARCLRSLGRVEEALAIQRALKDELDACGESDPDVDEEITACVEGRA